MGFVCRNALVFVGRARFRPRCSRNRRALPPFRTRPPKAFTPAPELLSAGSNGDRRRRQPQFDGQRTCAPRARLLRTGSIASVGGENIYRRRENLDYTVPDGFAGSILNLLPGTEYECRFQLTDPDGATGQTTHVARVTTRTEPMPSNEGRILHVYPPDHKGERLEPSFTSVLQAYYGAGLGDWSVVWERRSRPGDTILVHVGLYKPERFNYVDPMMTPFDGSMSLTLRARKTGPSPSRRPATERSSSTATATRDCSTSWPRVITFLMV